MQKEYLLKTNILLALLFMMNYPLVLAAELNGGNDIMAGTTVNNTATGTAVSRTLNNWGTLNNYKSLSNWGTLNNRKLQ